MRAGGQRWRPRRRRRPPRRRMGTLMPLVRTRAHWRRRRARPVLPPPRARRQASAAAMRLSHGRRSGAALCSRSDRGQRCEVRQTSLAVTTAATRAVTAVAIASAGEAAIGTARAARVANRATFVAMSDGHAERGLAARAPCSTWADSCHSPRRCKRTSVRSSPPRAAAAAPGSCGTQRHTNTRGLSFLTVRYSQYKY